MTIQIKKLRSRVDPTSKAVVLWLVYKGNHVVSFPGVTEDDARQKALMWVGALFRSLVRKRYKSDTFMLGHHKTRGNRHTKVRELREREENGEEI